MVSLDPQLAGLLTLVSGAVVGTLTVYGVTRTHPFHGSLLAGLVLAVFTAWALNATLDQLAFIAAAYLIVVFAAKVATSVAIMHGVFWLSLTLIGVAVIYLFVGAQVLAAVQVLIYVGAVITLILFAVIMTTPEVEEEEAPAVVAPIDEDQPGAPSGAAAALGTEEASG